MARNEVVDFTAFALHTFAGCLKIKIPRTKNDVRKEFEELDHGVLPRHGHHGVKGVGRRCHTEVGCCLIHFDFGCSISHCFPSSSRRPLTLI